jgi:hypothetical protein
MSVQQKIRVPATDDQDPRSHGTLAGISRLGNTLAAPTLNGPTASMGFKSVVALVMMVGTDARLSQSSRSFSCGLLVHGSTVCGYAACVAAARMGATCALIEPTTHTGGMSTGGLSSVDKRMEVGGIALEIFGHARFPHIEPHVQNATLAALLDGAGPGKVTLFSAVGGIARVVKKGTRIASVEYEATSENGVVENLSVTADVFIDCSYEGDLLRFSNTSFAVGREAASEFGESMAGVNGGKPWAEQAWHGVSPWADDTNTTLLPTVSRLPDTAATNTAPGCADDLVMACNYRLCLTNNASNRLPFDAPLGYNSSSMEWLRRWWTVDASAGARNGTLKALFLWEPLANSKADVNQVRKRRTWLWLCVCVCVCVCGGGRAGGVRPSFVVTVGR